MRSPATTPFIAIACGGTGGHLFPGLAVADELVKRGCTVTLLISPKEVDQQAVKQIREWRTEGGEWQGAAPPSSIFHPPSSLSVATLPAVALQGGRYLAFLRGCWQSWRMARNLFRARPPHAALAMGGFTSAPPILAARGLGAKTFLHESNTIPGRANRWLARLVDGAFVGFPSALTRLRVREATVTGTPVRSEFVAAGGADAGSCRMALGLDPAKPVLLVMGGSQGASGLNEMILSALPFLAKRDPHWQWLHLTGALDADKVRQAYSAHGATATVRPFLAEMNWALGAATVAVSRAGASSLAELAALRLPALLVPFPYATDNHQFYNARALTESGAAWLLEQKDATPEKVASLLLELVENTIVRERIQAALAQWHVPKAAEQIAEAILKVVGSEIAERARRTGKPTPSPSQEGNSRVARAAVFPSWEGKNRVSRAAEFPSWEGSGVGSSEMAQLIEERA